MTVLGRGDLAPPRRRRHRRRWPFLLLVLLIVAGGGWLGWHVLRSDDTATVQATPTGCRTAAPPPPPAAPAQVRVRVLNGTRRDGLAHEVTTLLRRRGFHVVHTGNTKPAARTTIVSTRDDLARVIALRIDLEQFSWSPTARRGTSLTLVIGKDFTRLVPAAQAAERKAVAVRVAHPTAPPCASSTPAS